VAVLGVGGRLGGLHFDKRELCHRKELCEFALEGVAVAGFFPGGDKETSNEEDGAGAGIAVVQQAVLEFVGHSV
jgi:hypothetical protein